MYKSTTQNSEFFLAIALVVMGIASRLVFHALNINNFNAVTATAVFAGAYLSRKRYALLIPMITMLLTDAVIGFYDTSYMAVVYGSFILAFAIGTVYSKKPSYLRYIVVALGGSFTFFLVTNFAWWPFYTTLYPHTLGGLIQSYVMGIPFYKNSIISDLLFSAILFGGFEMAKVYLPQSKRNVVLN
ncbi:MAG: DUF6580 family putative transport protein [bacterium]